MVHKDVQTGSFVVIFLTDGNLLISVGTNLAIYLGRFIKKSAENK